MGECGSGKAGQKAEFRRGRWRVPEFQNGIPKDSPTDSRSHRRNNLDCVWQIHCEDSVRPIFFLTFQAILILQGYRIAPWNLNALLKFPKKRVLAGLLFQNGMTRYRFGAEHRSIRVKRAVDFNISRDSRLASQWRIVRDRDNSPWRPILCTDRYSTDHEAKEHLHKPRILPRRVYGQFSTATMRSIDQALKISLALL